MDANTLETCTQALALRRQHNQWTATGMIRCQAERWHARLHDGLPMDRCVQAAATLAGYASLEGFEAAEARERLAQAQKTEAIEKAAAWLEAYRDADLAQAPPCPPPSCYSPAFSFDTLPPPLERWFHDATSPLAEPPRPHVLHTLTHWMIEQEVSDLYVQVSEASDAIPVCQFRVRGQMHAHPLSRASALALMTLTGCPTTTAGIGAGYPARLSLFPYALRVQGNAVRSQDNANDPVMMFMLRPFFLAMDEASQAQRDEEDPLLLEAFATLAAASLSASMPFLARRPDSPLRARL